MSDFIFKAIHKRTGEVHRIWALDNHFGCRQYGYQLDTDISQVMTDEQFNKEYEKKK